MSWYRGTEAPMDTSPAGPAQHSIFDAPAPLDGAVASSGHLYAAHELLPDVEMSTVTPPRPQAVVKAETRAEAQTESRKSRPPNTSSQALIPRARSKRNVLSRKGKRLAHLQTRQAGVRHVNSEDEEEYSDSDADTTSRSLSSYMLPTVTQATPELLLAYAQFIFNASILAAFLYMLYHLVRTVQRDVAEKVRAYEMDTLSDITACAAAYTANRCGTDMQAPALLAACKNWERCSARDPAVVGTARVTAETFAEILNGFVDAVSWKTMLFTLLSLSILVGATNSVLSFFRIKSRHADAPMSHPPYVHARPVSAPRLLRNS